MIKVEYSIYSSNLLTASETCGITQAIQNLIEIRNKWGKEVSVRFNVTIDNNPEIGPFKFSIENGIAFLVKLKNKKNIKSGSFKKVGNHIEYEEG